MKSKFLGTTITGLFEGKGFVQYEVEVNPRNFDSIMEVLGKINKGSKIRIKKAPDSAKCKAFLEFLTAEEVAEEKARYKEWKAKSTSDSI